MALDHPGPAGLCLYADPDCAFQRARAARLAICDRFLGESFAARALPPFGPPSFPIATACGFFSRAGGWPLEGVLPAGTPTGSPVTSWKMRAAVRMGSDDWRLLTIFAILERVGIYSVCHGEASS
jgi:hypothetical protein